MIRGRDLYDGPPSPSSRTSDDCVTIPTASEGHRTSFVIAESTTCLFPFRVSPTDALARLQSRFRRIPTNVLDYSVQMFLIANYPVIAFLFPKYASTSKQRINLPADESLHAFKDVLYAAAGLNCPWLGHPAPAWRLEATTTTGCFKPAAAYSDTELGLN